MAMTKEAFEKHRSKHGVTYMINFLTSILPAITVVGIIWSQIDKIVTTDDMSDAITSHFTGEIHPMAESQIKDINKKLDRGLALNLQARIEKLLLAQCKNPELRDLLAETLRNLVAEYEAVSSHAYIQPNCIQLGALQ